MSDVKAAQRSTDPLWVSSWQESYGEKTIVQRSQVKSDIKLYCSWFCPFAQRVWIALEELNINYKYIEINPYKVDPTEPGGYTKKQLPLSQKKQLYPEFIESSPRGLVPSLDVNGDLLYESTAILEYLNQKFGSNSGGLLPMNDPYKCTMVRIWCNYIESKIQKNFYVHLIDQNIENREKAKLKFFEECKNLAIAMESMSNDGPYFLGKEFSMIDIALAPFWLRYIWVGKYYRNLQFPENDKHFQRLNVWWNAVSNRQSVKNTIVCKERLISAYKHYSINVATSDYAKSISKDIKSNVNVNNNKLNTKNTNYSSFKGLGLFAVGFVAGVAAFHLYQKN